MLCSTFSYSRMSDLMFGLYSLKYIMSSLYLEEIVPWPTVIDNFFQLTIVLHWIHQPSIAVFSSSIIFVYRIVCCKAFRLGFTTDYHTHTLPIQCYNIRVDFSSAIVRKVNVNLTLSIVHGRLSLRLNGNLPIYSSSQYTISSLFLSLNNRP